MLQHYKLECLGKILQSIMNIKLKFVNLFMPNYIYFYFLNKTDLLFHDEEQYLRLDSMCNLIFIACVITLNLFNLNTRIICMLTEAIRNDGFKGK